MGKEIGEIAAQFGASDMLKTNAIFLVITSAGVLLNLLWCLFLGIKNKTIKEYTAGTPKMLAKNYSLTSFAGVLWYSQFLFYGMGVAKFGRYSFTAWSIHTTLVIALSNLWGVKHGNGKVSAKKLGCLVGRDFHTYSFRLCYQLGKSLDLTRVNGFRSGRW